MSVIGKVESISPVGGGGGGGGGDDGSLPNQTQQANQRRCC
jgi:hypothetical protein